jgi:hypothetical protein
MIVWKLKAISRQRLTIVGEESGGCEEDDAEAHATIVPPGLSAYWIQACLP